MSKTKLTLNMPDEELVIAAKQKALAMRISLSEAVAALLQGWLDDANAALLQGWAIQVARALGVAGSPAPDLSLVVPAAQRLTEQNAAMLAENTAQFHRIRELEAQIASAQEFSAGITPQAEYAPPQPTAVPGDGIQCTVSTPHNAAQCNGAHLPLSPNDT
jgi:hypothetical protein